MSESERSTVAVARQLVERFWSHFLQLEPVFGTEVGDERFDDRLPDPGPEGLARREGIHRSTLDALRHLDRSVLPVEERTALDMVEGIAARELGILRHRLDRFWAVSHMFGGYLMGPSQLLGQIGSLQRADSAERLDRYLARLAGFPPYMAAIAEVMREAVDAGQVAPAIVVDRSMALVRRQLEGGPESSAAMEPVAEASAESRERAVKALRDYVLPALATYLGALEEYRPSARDSIGLGALPGGDAMYVEEILGWTTVRAEPETLAALGEERLVAIGADARVIARSLGYQEAAEAVAAYTETGSNVGSGAALVDRVREQISRASHAAKGFFGHLPQAVCQVEAVPAFRERDVLDYYEVPAKDGSRPGIFYVNTRERPLHSLASVTFHETIPGHHLESALAVESQDRPPIRKYGNELQGAAFGEGWGLYSERLADEMGLYQDGYERIGMLELQALRAARLVVDTGIHAFRWTRDRALSLLESTGLPSWKAAAEVDRYIAMPGQALCYSVGQAEIERWRAAAARQEGGAFSLADFHDRLLAIGSLPLPALQREIQEAQGAVGE